MNYLLRSRNKLVALVLSIFIMHSIPNYAQLASQKLLTSDNKDIRKITGSLRSNSYGYVTDSGLTLVYQGSKFVFSKVNYNLSGTGYEVSFVNNIKDISSNIDGRIYVSTLNNHMLMFEEGKLLAGLPLKNSEFHQDWQGDVNTNLFYENNWYTVTLLNNPLNFKTRILSDLYPEIQTILNNLKPNQISINEVDKLCITDLENKEIAIGYESGYKLKWFKSSTSSIPCSKILDISIAGPVSFNGGTNKLQLYVSCEDGNLWLLNKDLSSSTIQNDLKASEWSKIDQSLLKGKVKEIAHERRHLLVGSTDALENNLFVLNANKETICHIDLPGNSKVMDFFFSPYESIALVSLGKQIYLIEIDTDECQNGISNVENNSAKHFVNFFPNPVKVGDIVRIEGIPKFEEIQVFEINGKQYSNLKMYDNQMIIDLPKGFYIIKSRDNNWIGKMIISE